jgi:hypothetical protein
LLTKASLPYEKSYHKRRLRMRKYLCGTVLCLMLVASLSFAQEKTAVSDYSDYQSWTKINAQTITGDVTGLLGRAHQAAKGFREVYVNKTGEDVAMGRKPYPFPAGTIIVKESYKPKGGGKGKLASVTVMVKREPGYDASNGDWEYINTSAELKVKGQGKISSCIVCHAAAENDFIFTER